ncbi:DUF5713 family protein [Psychromonas sp. Urea-02u-13]|uniref:DUF5713 family protein n=1 Tax=Psychromonas sp. Urea-02u-13 TaxID=2058326 RepID=UPI000C32C0CD|nr:DUF5713 family protein [Psychromonas sp. Urea-02u-13]PKG39090.1 hypothetical protein CXF74_10345 [Psychromonas sp. Urea-02u-13]
MQLINEEAKTYQFLNDMYEDGYFPNYLVDKGKSILIHLCYKIEDVQPSSLEDLYELTNQSTNEFNELQVEFEENESEIETLARDCIAVDFEKIAKIYGFDADIEALTATRDW